MKIIIATLVTIAITVIGIPILQTTSMFSVQSAGFAAKPISLFSGSVNNDFIKEAYATAGITDTKHSDGGIIDVQTVEGVVKEISTDVSELPPLTTNATATNATLSNVAFYSCYLRAPIVIQPGRTISIFCPVNALVSDRVLVTNSYTGDGRVVAAFPFGDPFGHVVIQVNNPFSSQITFGFDNRGFSIVVYCCETQVYAR